MQEGKIKKKTFPFTPWNSCLNLVFLTVKKGVLHLHVGKDIITLHSSQGIFIPPHMVFAIYQEEECSYLYYSFGQDTFLSLEGSALNKEFFLPWLSSHDLSYTILSPYVMKQKQILDQLDVIQYLYKQNGSILDIHIRILWMIQLLIPKERAKRGRKTNLYCAEKVVQYIEKEYSHKFDLDVLAKEVGLTKTSLCRRFKKETGESILDYLLKYRYYLSLPLLQKGTSLTSIVKICGFSTIGWYREKFPMVLRCSIKDYLSKQDGFLRDKKND